MGELIVRREGPVGTILFSNVARHNAMSYAMWHAFPERLHELDADPSIRVIVLTGDGRQAFVSGADISQFQQNREEEGMQQAYNRALVTAYRAPSRCEKPVIAKIRGFCMGGGLAVAMAADLRVSAEDGQFGIPAARLSIAYPPDSVKKLIDLVGPAHARMILYTARRIDEIGRAHV